MIKLRSILTGMILLITLSSCKYQKMIKNLYGEDGKYQYEVQGNTRAPYTISEFIDIAQKVDFADKNSTNSKITQRIENDLFKLALSKKEKFADDINPPRPPVCAPAIWPIPKRYLYFVNDSYKTHKLLKAKISQKGHDALRGESRDIIIVFPDFNSSNPKLLDGTFDIEIQMINKRSGAITTMTRTQEFRKATN